MSSGSVNNNKEDLSGALSTLNIGNNESNNNEEEEENTITMICANCGKEGDGDNMNSCNKCDLVKYCNAACKKKHRHKHKKKCEKRVAELYDEKLFREPPPPEECPICFLPLPLAADQVTFHSCCGKSICNGCIRVMVEREGANILCAFCRTPCAESEEAASGSTFNPCCGKHICSGCIYAMAQSEGDDSLCPFCRTPVGNSDEEDINRLEKLMEKGNGGAFYNLAGCYARGRKGMPQNGAKANELLLKAGELGCAEAYFNLGIVYGNGMGVEIDEEKAKHYWELAAMNGNVKARHNLGALEGRTGNSQRAMKHFILAARAGLDEALDTVKLRFMNGIVTKDEYANTLRAYQKSKDEMKSEARDKVEAIISRY